jgi:hypothetical protein
VITCPRLQAPVRFLPGRMRDSAGGEATTRAKRWPPRPRLPLSAASVSAGAAAWPRHFGALAAASTPGDRAPTGPLGRGRRDPSAQGRRGRQPQPVGAGGGCRRRAAVAPGASALWCRVTCLTCPGLEGSSGGTRRTAADSESRVPGLGVACSAPPEATQWQHFTIDQTRTLAVLASMLPPRVTEPPLHTRCCGPTKR